MRRELWIIESRNPDGSLDLSGPQPESAFGVTAIIGTTADEMARVIFRHDEDAVLTGDSISRWPSLLDPRWVARRKTW